LTKVPTKVLVTGSKGFIGSHLVNFLKSEGYWVRGVDIKKHSYLETREDQFFQGDLRDQGIAYLVMRDIDLVFHLAAEMGGIGFITRVKANVMRDSTLININILEACRKRGTKRLFYSSSACVYPENLQLYSEVEPLKESDAIPACPDTAYGWEKLYAEQMLKAYREDYGLDIRIARFHNIYGSHCTYRGGREKAPAALCRKVALAHNLGEIEVWGDGRQSRSFLYITDALDAIYRLMLSNYTEPLNIGSDELITINQLADFIIEASGKEIGKRYNVKAPQGVRGRNACLDLIKKTLGWKPKVSYKTGLTKTYNWVLEQVNRQ